MWLTSIDFTLCVVCTYIYIYRPFHILVANKLLSLAPFSCLSRLVFFGTNCQLDVIGKAWKLDILHKQQFFKRGTWECVQMEWLHSMYLVMKTKKDRCPPQYTMTTERGIDYYSWELFYWGNKKYPLSDHLSDR